MTVAPVGMTRGEALRVESMRSRSATWSAWPWARRRAERTCSEASM